MYAITGILIMKLYFILCLIQLLVRLTTHILATEAVSNITADSQLCQTCFIQSDPESKQCQNIWKQPNDTSWSVIAEITGHIWVTHNNFYNQNISFEKSMIIFIFDRTWHAARILEVIISYYLPYVTFVYYKFEDITGNMAIRQSLDILVNFDKINTMFLLADQDQSSSVFRVMEYVSLKKSFKWTSIIHTVEWIIVTTNPNLLNTFLSNKPPGVDFVTLLTVISGRNITIAQKSRKQTMRVISQWNRAERCPERGNCDSTISNRFFETFKSQILISYKRGKLRANSMIYLKSQLSVLDGLHLRASLFITEEKLVQHLDGNATALGGYCIALLDICAAVMGFTYENLLVKDGGYYGIVYDYGSATGITGQLARREAAITPMPLAAIENRKGRFDIVPVPMVLDMATFIYRLPDEDIDKTYLYIIKKDFILMCLGPMLVACILGAVMHITTKSCTSAAPESFTMRNLRKLSTFPNHICFHAATDSASHSGCILKASWNIMWFICVSAYSAYLTSTFTVTSPELKIKSIKDLVNAKNYEFGLHGRLTALIDLLRNSDDPYLSSVWTSLVKRNETEPMVLSENSSYHIGRVVAGGYVYIAPSAIQNIAKKLREDIRSYKIHDIPSINADYISIPTNTFYKEELYKFMLNLHESRINLHLQEKYLIQPMEKESEIEVSDDLEIQFSRLELTFYAVLCGVGISTICLFVEVVFYRFNFKLLKSRIRNKSRNWKNKRYVKNWYARVEFLREDVNPRL